MDHCTKKGQANTITKNQTAQIKVPTGYISLDFGKNKNKLCLAPLSQWSNVFQNKEKSLTTNIYLYDPSLYDPAKPTSTARKILGQNEVIIIGSIRNPTYLGREIDTSYLDREHLQIELKSDQLHLKNLSAIPVTITYYE